MSHHRTCECDHCEERGGGSFWVAAFGLYVIAGLVLYAWREVAGLLNL